MTLSADELKPCPFCGGKAEHHAFTGNGFTLARVAWTQVRCTGCRMETQPFQPFGDGTDRAIAAWNRRAPDQAAELNAELVGALGAANEALGMVTAFESDARYIMGNTNYEIVKVRRQAIQDALSKAKGSAGHD